MTDRATFHGRKRGRGVRPWLLSAKFIGLTGFLGGLTSLGAMGIVGPTPSTQEGWELLRALSRAIFFPCVFCGLVLAVLAGACLFGRQATVYFKLRWFRVKLVALTIFIPGCHLWVRGHVTRMYDAIEDGRLADAAASYQVVSIAYLVSAGIFILIALVSRHKPRLGEALGARSPRPAPNKSNARS